MKTICIIQARTGSTRLSGKILKLLAGKPMLAQLIERIKQAKMVDAFIVATTDKPEDNVTADLALKSGVQVFRGSEQDVLDRYYQAAKQAHADIVVRVTGDCPLHYGALIDETIVHFAQAHVDYARSPSNYPEGLDTEVFTFAALERAWREARLPSEREHVTPYLYTHPELFTCDTEWTPAKGDRGGMHWSVDTPEDFEFVSRIFEALYTKNPDFTKEDVYALLAEHSDWLALNKGATGYEGYRKSLREDEEWENTHE